MTRTPKLSTLATTVLVLAATAGSCALPDGTGLNQPAGINLPALDGTSRSDALAELTVAPEASMAGYDRDEFPHWSTQPDGCDTRETVLAEHSHIEPHVNDCDVEGGKWQSLYDNTTVTDPSELDIDHLVPLAEAWRSGADAWSEQQREAFANDLTGLQLLPVSASTNRAKSDQDPATWMPPNAEAHCGYVENWIQIKRTHGLTVDPAEHAALTEALAPCEAVHPN